jgi:hypothetical protein
MGKAPSLGWARTWMGKGRGQDPGGEGREPGQRSGNSGLATSRAFGIRPTPMEPANTPPPLPPSLPGSPRPGSPVPAQTGGLGNRTVLLLIFGGMAVVALPVIAILAAMLLPALAKAKGRAQEVQCANHLKNLGLGALIYATDHEGVFPGSWQQTAASMEGMPPNNLTCAADKGRAPATDWASVTDANISYPWYGRGAKEGNAQRVLSICPVHGHVLVADGSVMRRGRGLNPIPVVERDGGTWLKD